MSLFAGFGIDIIFIFVFMVIISGLLMWMASKISRVEKASFTRAFTASIASSFVSALASVIFTIVVARGMYLGFVVGLLLSIIIIKLSFRTNFGKTLLVWIFDIFGAVLAIALTIIITTRAFLR